MNAGTQQKMIHHFIQAQGRSDAIYLIQTSYWESDAMNAVGQLVKSGYGIDGKVTCVLNTSDALSPLWCSPEADLWIGSAWGNVWTTANIEVPPLDLGDITYTEVDPGFHWTVSKLPVAEGIKYSPNVTALWGTANSNVIAGTFEGAIYHWNGRAWVQTLRGNRECINKIHGSSSTDVYAVGEKGAIFHYDGTAWTRLPYPEGAGQNDGLTGVRSIGPEEAFICGRSGRVLHGNRNGFEILATAPAPLYGIAYFHSQLYLAAGNGGVWQLVGSQPKQIKDTFKSVGVFEVGPELVFVEPVQATPSYILHNPDASRPWVRITYAG